MQSIFPSNSIFRGEEQERSLFSFARPAHPNSDPVENASEFEIKLHLIALQDFFQFIKNTSKIYSCWLLCLNCERLDLKLKLKEPKEMWKTKDKVLDWFG